MRGIDGMAKWLYRLESKTSDKGLWYNLNNEYVFVVGELEDCPSKDFYMGYDERYQKDGRNWYSSCSNKQDILHWFTVKNILDLIAKGFVLARYLATEYVEYENETTFIKDTALAREEIDIRTIFN